jgi:bud site selection protein 20
MGRVARKKQHKGDRPLKEKYRTRRRTKDLDQIHDDLQPVKSTKLLQQEVNYDVTGNAQFYCLHCAYEGFHCFRYYSSVTLVRISLYSCH